VTAAEEKIALRREALSRRAEAARAAPDAAMALVAHAPMLPAAGVVAAYVAMRHEIDPMPLAQALAARGASLALPAVAGGVMTFRAWAVGDPLVPGTFGTREPEGASVVPDLLLVPLLAFTREGYRLGYGGGYYDTWLAAHPGVATWGVAYAAQEVPRLPVEPHDQPLSAILTERELIRPGDSGCV
jgi:5-formyltetrahydrofolate cyclo-ligase